MEHDKENFFISLNLIGTGECPLGCARGRQAGWLRLTCSPMTASKKMSWYESAKHAFLKVVKWHWKKWKWPILMQIYVKQCEIMQKNQWKGPNFQIQCFYNGRSLTDRSSLLKTWKTRETKTWITQNFELVWPIQGRTMWKLTSWRFQKCGSFWWLKVLNQSYWLSKSSENWRKNSKEMRCHKKKTRPQFSILRSVTESVWAQYGWFHADSVTELKIENCGRVFFFDTA